MRLIIVSSMLHHAGRLRGRDRGLHHQGHRFAPASRSHGGRREPPGGVGLRGGIPGRDLQHLRAPRPHAAGLSPLGGLAGLLP
eukprot:5078702-Pyramimonas_sp.AAC.2